VPEAPLRVVPAEDEDRFARFRLIGWWDQARLEGAKVLVVGAGALGNEILKDLALLGVGRVFVADLDRVERSNLARSVLFREGDEGRPKAEAAAARMREIHPAVRVRPFVGNALTGIGLGVYEWADVVLAGLDNREARLAANRACWLLGRTYVDGAIEALAGVARVFRGPEGACYECTMGEADWRQVEQRRSCALLGRDAIPERHVPTTPTSASVVAGIQCQEAVKHLHGLETLRGSGFVFDGVAHESYRVAYTRSPSCGAHDVFERVEPFDGGAATTTVDRALAEARRLLGPGAVVELPGDLVTSFRCAPCGTERRAMRRLEALRERDSLCAKCGAPMAPEIATSLDGSEGLGGATLAEAGLPPFDVVRCRSGERLAGLRLEADRGEALGALAESRAPDGRRT
jgi:molybdopterin/thiamine biosynthesis adenylyltransferase